LAQSSKLDSSAHPSDVATHLPRYPQIRMDRKATFTYRMGCRGLREIRWRHRIHDEIRARMRLQGCLSVERMCQLAEVSRAGFHRYLQGGSEAEEALALRSAIQDVVMEHRWRYGYRRVAQELRTQGWIVNHERIARIMVEGRPIHGRSWEYPFFIDVAAESPAKPSEALQGIRTAPTQLRTLGRYRRP
jgi:HTH-like domain